MSLLSELKPKQGSQKNRKRIGRGHSAGGGKTAGKGHKGQKARKGGSIIRGFEGGQMPMARRLPKFGFTNGQFKTTYEVFNVKDLEALSAKIGSTEISPKTLFAKNIISKSAKLKILGEGETSKNLTVVAHKFTAKAKELIEKAGGSAEVIVPRPIWRKSMGSKAKRAEATSK